MKSLKFTVVTIFYLSLLTIIVSCSSQSEKGQKPNILFIAIDDMNDWVGVLGGHPQAKTPTSTNWLPTESFLQMRILRHLHVLPAGMHCFTEWNLTNPVCILSITGMKWIKNFLKNTQA